MLDGEVDHYRKVVATDLDSVFYCARAAGKVWRRQTEEGTDLHGRTLQDYRSGSFIATASMSGSIVNIPQLQAAYNGAKAGVIHLGQFFQAHAIQKRNKLTLLSSAFTRCRVGQICAGQ